MTDAHQRKLKQLDHHIRSASTLAHIIWYSGDAPAERSEKLNKRPDKVLHLLNHLAHCLVRVPRENVAVGLLTGSSRLVVSNSLLESPSTPDSKKSDENDTEELHRAACAGATLGASPSAAPSAKGSAATEENLHLDKIFEMICSHGTANKDKGADSELRGLDPQFPSHARMMFQLFKGYLKTAVDTPEEHQTRIRFEIYVLGMSLQRLEDKIQEPKWKGREVGTQEMQDFLKSSYSCVDVPKFQMTSTEKDEFKSFLAFGKLEIDPETEKDIEKCAFTDNVASLFHDLLKQLFTNATDRLRALKKYPIRGKMKEGNTSQELDVFKKQQEGFGKDLKKLWFNLLVLNGCNNVCKRLMQAYLGAIKNVTRPPTPSNSRNNDNNDDEIDNDEDDEDDEDDEGNRSLTWTTAYHAWIRRMVRQTNAAGALTSLNAQWKMRLSKIDFDIVEEQAPDTTMEAWETTIKTICTNSKNPSLAKEVIKALRTIASGNTPGQDKVYAPLKGRNKWEKAFRGSIHCEAMIASRDLVRGVQGCPKFGVSKRCCVICSFLIEGLVSHLWGSEIFPGISFLGSSNKIWACALPRGCPLAVAKEVGRRLDEKLEGVLETSLPRLKARAEKYSSSGSGSGGEPSENDDLNFGDLNVSYKINHDIDDVNEDFQVAFN